MKLKTTRKAIKENAAKVLAVSYCSLQYLFNYREPFAYSTRVEGWACDYYDIGGGVIVSTGYAPIGEHVSYDVCRKYEELAQDIIFNNSAYEDKRTALDDLIQEFRKEVAKQ